jgi:hypothetical protein
MGLFTILVIIVVALGCYLQYLYNKDKLSGYRRYFLLLLLVLSAILVIRQDHEKKMLYNKLEQFVQLAQDKYPGLNQEKALAQLAFDISKMHPKLVFLTQTEPRRDPVSNLFHTNYGFRSEPTNGLKDVQIEIRFNGRFVSITGGKKGDIVEGGELLTPYPDSTGFNYTTRYLNENNDIVITVTSKEPLKIVSMTLLPQ